MRIFISSDHAAFNEKQALVEYLKDRYEVVDLGPSGPESTHYPLWAIKLVKKVKGEESLGILLCGSGIGVSIVANRFKGIRAALCRDEDDAKMSKLHNNANVLCLGGRKTSLDSIKKIADVFLATSFEGGRHQTRIDLFNDLGQE